MTRLVCKMSTDRWSRVVLVLLCWSVSVSCNGPVVASYLRPASSEHRASIAPVACQGCAARRKTIEAVLSTDQINSLRKERIKQQILRKLRLSEPPNVSISSFGFPKALNTEAILNRLDFEKQKKSEGETDEFYGKTDQVILFPQEVSVHCSARRDALCFTLRLPSTLQSDDVTTAHLWIYKAVTVSTQVVLSERLANSTVTLGTYSPSGGEGWFKVDLEVPVRKWASQLRDPRHTIEVACSSCNDQLKDHRPFLVVNTTSVSQKSRPRRDLNCGTGVSECCREKLYISFADIGWDSWIIQPPGYHAYYCRGSCSSAASLTRSAAHYNTIVRKFLQQGSRRQRSLELVPCCTATRLSSLQLLYLDIDGSITQKTLPNMVVDSCGCM